jgi:hypothetical protein
MCSLFGCVPMPRCYGNKDENKLNVVALFSHPRPLSRLSCGDFSVLIVTCQLDSSQGEQIENKCKTKKHFQSEVLVSQFASSRDLSQQFFNSFSIELKPFCCVKQRRRENSVFVSEKREGNGKFHAFLEHFE